MNPFFEQAQQFTQMWMDLATKMMSAGMSFDPAASPMEAARQLRNNVSRAMAQSTEQLMRSPVFGDIMKQMMDANMSFQRQMNDLLTDARHQTQGVARQDVDGLHVAMQHVENRLLDEMDAISAKLDDISDRLAAVERAARRPAPRPAPARRRTAAAGRAARAATISGSNGNGHATESRSAGGRVSEAGVSNEQR